MRPGARYPVRGACRTCSSGNGPDQTSRKAETGPRLDFTAEAFCGVWAVRGCSRPELGEMGGGSTPAANAGSLRGPLAQATSVEWRDAGGVARHP